MPAPQPSYREKLPKPNCPPEDAAPLAAQQLVRLARSEDVTDEDFKSYAALGLPCSNGRECEWSACSMFLHTVTKSQLDGLRKFPNLRDKKIVVFVKVDQDSGLAKVSKTKHVSLWMFKAFEPVNSITKKVAIDDF